MKNNYETSRLSLSKLTLDDTEFIFELVNTAEWIKFIGNRNVSNNQDAAAYIQKLIENPAINYWVVKTKDRQTSIGIVTFIKRDYLDHYDIGFAFLPEYTKQGNAYEATAEVLNDIINNTSHTLILATTTRENINSIRLLEKLGFLFSNEIQQDNETLMVFSATKDKLRVDQITRNFYAVFNNKNKNQPAFNRIHTLCLPETIIIKKSEDTEVIYSLDTFIEPREKILSDGTLTEFEEHEIFEETKITGNIAQRFSKYQKSGLLNGNHFQQQGNKFFQFVKTKDGWKINSLIWEDDSLKQII